MMHTQISKSLFLFFFFLSVSVLRKERGSLGESGGVSVFSFFKVGG